MANQKQRVEQSVRRCLQELMDRAGLQGTITLASRPGTDLGLDSEYGVEFACMIEEILQMPMDPRLNPFRDERDKERTAGEIVDYLCGLLQETGAHD
jgi:acyl carrier protein